MRPLALLMAVALAGPAAAGPRSVVLILADDHRHDALGCAGHPFLRTPHLDRLAAGGARFASACVTTALCSPSRASILTGMYAHRHRVTSNNEPVPAGLTFFPQLLQKAGYRTAFVGKWHMGHETDAPQRGFDHWVSFRGQGVYNPTKAGLNVNGTPVPQKGYITDELTDYALDWLKAQDAGRPFFLYLSHKAVHADFTPAARHRGRYADAPMPVPATQADPGPDAGRPMWVRNQRESYHGVGFPYHGELGDLPTLYRRYCETLLAVDDSVGRVLDHLKATGRLDDTLVLYAGDNGFAWGEHGLIDKRTAYEESMRVPLIAHGPGLFAPGSVPREVVANIDLAPTVLEAAGVPVPANLDGRSLLPLGRGDARGWREELLYEYFWERNFPHTPTLHALRTARYKYVRAHGVWDTDELYDLAADPGEARNLVRDPAHRDAVRRLNARLFDILEATGGTEIPLPRDRGGQQRLRRPGGPGAAEFPAADLAPAGVRPG